MSALHRAQDSIAHLVCQGANEKEVLDFIYFMTLGSIDRKKLKAFYHDLLCTILDANYSNGEGQ